MITIGNNICLKKTKDFHKALALMTLSIQFYLKAILLQIVLFIVLLLITCAANMFLYSPIGHMALEKKELNGIELNCCT